MEIIRTIIRSMSETPIDGNMVVIRSDGSPITVNKNVWNICGRYSLGKMSYGVNQDQLEKLLLKIFTEEKTASPSEKKEALELLKDLGVVKSDFLDKETLPNQIRSAWESALKEEN